MSQTAAHLADHVIPHVAVRRRILSLPIALSLLLASQPELVTSAQRVITRHLLDRAWPTGELRADEDHGGAVRLI